MDEDNDRQLAVKEVQVDPNFSNDTRKVYLTARHAGAYVRRGIG